MKLMKGKNMTDKLELRKINVGEDIYDEVTGELISEGKIIEIFTRPDVPFRSITDLKGYDDSELNTMPSMTNTKDFVPIKKTIAMVLKNYKLEELEILAEKQKEFGDFDEYDDDNYAGDNVDEFGDAIDAADFYDGQKAIETELEESQQSTKEALQNDAQQSDATDGVDADTLA